jgi:hypothetical protein
MDYPSIADPADLESARAMFQLLTQMAHRQGVPLRAPPPEPTTCCARGCNGCVWEGFFAAAAYWKESALAALGTDTKMGNSA